VAVAYLGELRKRWLYTCQLDTLFKVWYIATDLLVAHMDEWMDGYKVIGGIE